MKDGQLISLKIPEFTKSIIENTEQGILEAVEEGAIRPIEAHVWGKALSRIGATITKSTFERASSEVEQFKEDNLRGAKMTLKNGGSTLQYSDDAEWSRLSKLLKERESLIKMASSNNSGSVVDSDGAEVFPVSRKERADSITVTFS